MYKTVSMCSLFYFEGVLYQNMYEASAYNLDDLSLRGSTTDAILSDTLRSI